MLDQKALKEIYKQEATEYWQNQKMIDYCMKKAAYIVELEDGNYTIIDRPEIETHFCFGYGYCGMSTEDDWKGAAAMAEKARNDQDYFISENLKGLEESIKSLQDESLEIYKFVGYNGQRAETRRRSFRIVEMWHNPEYDPWAWTMPEVKKMTDQERQALIAGYEEVKKAFIKRLNTYLKRYGLSKVKSWSYLSD